MSCGCTVSLRSSIPRIFYVYSNEQNQVRVFLFFISLVLRASHACSRHVCIFAPHGPWWSVRPAYFLGTLRNLKGVLGRVHIAKSVEFAHGGAIAFQCPFCLRSGKVRVLNVQHFVFRKALPRPVFPPKNTVSPRKTPWLVFRTGNLLVLEKANAEKRSHSPLFELDGFFGGSLVCSGTNPCCVGHTRGYTRGLTPQPLRGSIVIKRS